MDLNLELLEQVCTVPGTSGYEMRIRDFIIKEIDGLVDSIEIDSLGNVYALRKGDANPEQKKVMVAAHMDEIGFMVSHIDDQGFLRFRPIGGFDPKTLTSMRVVVHGRKDLIGVMGAKPIHLMSAEERNRAVKLEDFTIDLGLPKSEVEKYVAIGDTVTRHQPMLQVGECINMKSLDNRASVFILIETLRNLKQCPYDFYALFTVQEEVGVRGSQVPAHKVNPDFAIALDVTIANDTPGTPTHEKVTVIGKGTGIKIMDGRTICDYRMVDFLKSTADRGGIEWQPEILPFGGTDATHLQKMGKDGAITGAISTPVRYVHQTIEMMHPNDVRGSIELLTAAIETLDKYNWSH
ncbi:MAG: M42 family metallopeptidase [Flammeovirgaceae bacterium]